MNRKPVIVWLSDSPFFNTGYATISRNICNYLSQFFDVHYLANGYSGQTLPPGVTLEDGTKFNFTIHGNGRENYFKDLIMYKIQKYKPDYFCVLLDTFMLFPWILKQNFSPAKSMFYFPSDGGGGLPLGCENILRHFNFPVAMAKFGQKQAKELHKVDTLYIPHAIDTNIYRPLSDNEKAEIRKEYVCVSIQGTKAKGFLTGKYVVGCVARNQPRKMLDMGLKAFARFCKDKPDAVFLFHSDVGDAAAMFDLRVLVQRLGIENRVVFSDMKYFDNFEYKEMNKVYNVMDCFFLSTSGEGFGIPTIEAMACEVPVIVTDYTTTSELIEFENKKAGIGVPVAEELTGSWCVERAIMSVSGGEKALNLLYFEPAVRKEMGKLGRMKVLSEYDWNKVLPQWRDLFLKGLN